MTQTEVNLISESIQQKRVDRSLGQFFRFFVECFLLWGLGALIWCASHLFQIRDIQSAARLARRYPSGMFESSFTYTGIWTPFLIYSLVGCTLFLIIFYGTSYHLTPFRILLPFIKKAAYVKVVSTELHQPLLDGEREDENHTSGAARAKRVEVESLDTKNKTVPDVEVIDSILNEAGRSTIHLAQRMEDRINLHLTFGVLTGGVGLAVWYMTFYHGQAIQAPGVESIGGRLVDALPRITILFFIELLAGFFLRQYRIGVEDLKYFLELRRRAEFKRIAYLIYERVNNTDAKLAFARQLLEERSDTRLAAGEMTTTLHAIDKEKNEFISGLQAVAEKFQSIAKDLKEAKAAKT